MSELGDFGPELSAAIDQSLARDPAQRSGSADALADALEFCQERWFKQTPTVNPSESAGPQVIAA